MSRTFFKSVLAGLLVLVVSAFWTTPVMAAPKPSPDMTIMAEGWHNEVTQTRALYQCPAFHCNQGQAYVGNDLAEVCTVWQSGVKWGLVFNRANEHSGFIPVDHLKYADPPQSCNNVGWGTVSQNNYALYQCPYNYCNQGFATAGDDVAAICYHVANNFYWWWSLNHANGHEGFRAAAGTGGYPRC